ncbi:hypothetical protein [Roseomonas indoligenes]|uniref:Uncharacterized protein n=1 Tax=Roseomonas indoligenes TaxID=2820811 RepID=A0A940N199_9PROT|nr:hypothetical protein [Pararoseomonas indoligenes]MBP0494694.1 hypothetical protein [Pararoseomonas indoligenes]
MPRLLNALGFVAFVVGAVALAFALYILLAGVIGWNPFSTVRPMLASVNAMITMGVIGIVLMMIGAMLAVAAARAAWRREMQAVVAP